MYPGVYRAQESTGEPRRAQESPGEPRRAQESAGERRRAQESAGEARTKKKCFGTLKKRDLDMNLMTLLLENTQKSYFLTKPSTNSGVATCVSRPPFSYRDIVIAGAKLTS